MLAQLSQSAHLPRIEVTQAEFGAGEVSIRCTRRSLDTAVQVSLLMQLVDCTAGVFKLDGSIRRVKVEDVDFMRCEGARGGFDCLAQLLRRVIPGLGGKASVEVRLISSARVMRA